jgi:MoaA/NifB/PqqE/SkfB family radical SAM enzyme
MLDIWRQLTEFSPHGCRVHLTGGEPFGDWDHLLELARCARAEGLGPLQKVETNAFWATEEDIVRRRVEALAEAGMEKFSISADPYHQQFVPIARARLAASVARDLLGEQRVQVRWEDWLVDGCDTADMSTDQRAALLARYAADGRDRLNGRAAERLADLTERKHWQDFADSPCRKTLLRGKQVHVGPDGLILPGTCAGIVLGRVDQTHGIAEAWETLNAEYAQRVVVGVLAEKGPVGLVERAMAGGFVPDQRGYAGKCHLCWEVRRFLASGGANLDELGPVWMYSRRVGSSAVDASGGGDV